MIGNAAGILKALRLYQHHLQLRRGIDIHDLVVFAGLCRCFFGRFLLIHAVIRLDGKAPERVILLFLLVGFLKIILKFLVADPHKILEFIDETHNDLLA